MSRLSPMLLVAILLVSMLFIYLVPGQGDLTVGLVTLIILVVGLFLAVGGTNQAQQESAHRLLSILATMSALASAALIGIYLTNSFVGLLCAPVLLALGYVGLVAAVSNMGINVEEGELLLSQRRMDRQHIIRPPGLHQRMISGLEAGIAVMPTYVIQTEVHVEDVDTHSLYKVAKVMLDVSSRIIQHFPDASEEMPAELRYEGFLRLPYHYPNRDRVFKDMAGDIGIEPAEARMRPDFWIKAIQQQISHDVDEELRDIIHNHRFNFEDGSVHYLNPSDISEHRKEISLILKRRLQPKVQHWGIEILEVSISKVVLNPESVEFYYKEKKIELEAREAEKRAEIEAKQRRIMAETEHEILQQQYELEEAHQQKQIQAELAALRQRHNLDSLAVLQMINEFMDSMRKYDTQIDASDIQRLLLLALDEHKRMQYVSTGNLHQQPGAGPKPESGTAVQNPQART